MARAAPVQPCPRRQAMTASVLRGLARFADLRGVPAGPEFLLDYDVIEAFCVTGLPGRASSTRGTYRSVLYRLAAGVHGAPGRRATPFAGARAPAPYSPAERAELAAIAGAQRDPARRSSALAMAVLGIGAGLRPGELTALRGTQVTRRGGRAAVEVTGGPAPRTVPVACRYAGPAARALRPPSASLSPAPRWSVSVYTDGLVLRETRRPGRRHRQRSYAILGTQVPNRGTER